MKVALGGGINGFVFILLSVSLKTLNSNVLLLLKNGLKLTELDAMHCGLMGTDIVTSAFSPLYSLLFLKLRANSLASAATLQHICTYTCVCLQMYI